MRWGVKEGSGGKFLFALSIQDPNSTAFNSMIWLMGLIIPGIRFGMILTTEWTKRWVLFSVVCSFGHELSSRNWFGGDLSRRGWSAVQLAEFEWTPFYDSLLPKFFYESMNSCFKVCEPLKSIHFQAFWKSRWIGFPFWRALSKQSVYAIFNESI